MGFGKVFKQTDNQIQQLAMTNAAQQAQLQAAEQSQREALASQQKSVEQAATAAVSGPASTAQQAALGVLDYIHTSSQGLLNNPKTGRLTILGN